MGCYRRRRNRAAEGPCSSVHVAFHYPYMGPRAVKGWCSLLYQVWGNTGINTPFHFQERVGVHVGAGHTVVRRTRNKKTVCVSFWQALYCLRKSFDGYGFTSLPRAAGGEWNNEEWNAWLKDREEKENERMSVKGLNPSQM